MRAIRAFPIVWFAIVFLRGQATAPDLNPAEQPDLQTLSSAVRSLRRTSALSEDVKAKADKLIAEAAQGPAGARRKLANAWVLLRGGAWDQKQELAWSLALRPDAVVADTSLPFFARLTQMYPASWPEANGLKLRVSLLDDHAAVVRQIGSFDLPSRDLAEQPFGIDADLDGVTDGAYVLNTEVLQGGSAIASVRAPIQLVNGIERDRSAVERRLARIQGHDGAKATVKYPYTLAVTVNAGHRQLTGADFGLPYQPQLPYDFAKGVRSSNDLLKSLEAGKDPLYRAKGEHVRHYWFEEAREMMAYHLYAPMKWDGKSKLPMVLVLHGNSRDQDYYFDRDDHILAKLAEQHGYLVVCPMGYRPSAGWGSNSLNRPQVKQGELSEKDALNVLDLVTKEYPVDPARIYLFGHSAGGAGTWYLGEKYPEKWTAIAMSAAATRPDGFPFERLKGLPLMVCHGDKDDEVPVTSSRNMVKAAQEHGLDPKYLEVPGATHATIVATVEPKVFDFFDQHPSRK